MKVTATPEHEPERRFGRGRRCGGAGCRRGRSQDGGTVGTGLELYLDLAERRAVGEGHVGETQLRSGLGRRDLAHQTLNLGVVQRVSSDWPDGAVLHQ